MTILVLKLPDVKRKRKERPRECPYCGGETFQRWRKVKKAVKDIRARTVWVYRYRCCRCGRTFRHYPEGTSRADQTERLKWFAVIGWTLGLSYRGVSTLLSGLQVRLCPMTVWRDAQDQAAELEKRNRWKPVRVLGVDGEFVLGWGEKRSVMVAVDWGEGQPVAVGYVDEHDVQAVRNWLQPLVQRLGVSVIVTDDLALYRTIASPLNLEHQVCQFHVRRWVGRAIRELEHTLPQEWLGVLDEVKKLVEQLPPDGNRRLYVLWKQVSVRRGKDRNHLTPVDQLRDLLIQLSEAWKNYCAFYSDPAIPWTNNGTEQVIGRMKMRTRTVRGYQSWPGMQAGLMLAGTRRD